ncbi:MAG: hypothetical protein QOD77_1047 [Thermoplasmata archaeon]|jgi:hypothetical protein|nr:hypothetical protein [Thermoplasmata archaeon]
MKAIPALLTAAALVFVLMPMGVGASTTPAIRFGMDAAGVTDQTNAGVKPDYGTFWVGPWTLSSGWAGPDAELAAMKAAGVTPAVHFYYWGDDISQSCVTNGCWSTLHGAQKTQAGWNTLKDQFVQHLNAKMGGSPVLVFLETEFNKGDVQAWEPLDGMLADKAHQIKTGYPAAKVVLALGNWNSAAWGTWDRAAAASDMTGIQAMRGSTRDSSAHYDDAYAVTLAGAKTLQALFHKPIVLQDLAFSSYPEPTYLGRQATVLKSFFTGIEGLRAAGVTAILYRSYRDTNMDTANYYGEAERHWGLAYSNGAKKAAATVWIDGVKAERARAGTTVPTTTTTPTTTTGTTFAIASSSNEWWLQLQVSPAQAKVDAKVGAADWKPMQKQSYGWTLSTHVVKGTLVQFRATDGAGKVVLSEAKAWLSTTTTTPTAGMTATFTPKSVGNAWWVEAAATSPQGVSKVESRTNGGAWTVLPKTSWGTYAKSLYVAPGAKVEFRATSPTGAMAMSPAYTWSK